MKSEVRRLADQYQFFHWHLGFPDVFQLPELGQSVDNPEMGWGRGFDVVLGNPPWERIKFQENEWLTNRLVGITVPAAATARNKLVGRLQTEDPDLYSQFIAAKRESDGFNHLLRTSRLFERCGVGRDINSAAVFSERIATLISTVGRAGLVLPSSIATETTTRLFFQYVLSNRLLVSFFDFENRKPLFSDVHRMYRFGLMTLQGTRAAKVDTAEFLFFAHDVSDLGDSNRRFRLTFEDVRFINPTTMTCPVFRCGQDAAIARKVYGTHSILAAEEDQSGDWPFRTRPGLFHMGNDAALFQSDSEKSSLEVERSECASLYEAKMLHQFDHRWATFDNGKFRDTEILEHIQAAFEPNARYKVPLSDIVRKLSPGVKWLLGVRDVTNASNERTVIAAAFPAYGAADTIMLLDPTPPETSSPRELLSACNSFVFDYCARQKVPGVHLKPNVFKQLPIPSPTLFQQESLWQRGNACNEWLLWRALELTYTAWDLEAFALDCGYDGPPFRWDEERRFLLRCELDAAYFHLYLGTSEEWGKSGEEVSGVGGQVSGESQEGVSGVGDQVSGKRSSAETGNPAPETRPPRNPKPETRNPSALAEMFPTPRHAVEYIMETFPIVKRKDIKRTTITDENGQVTQPGTYITKDTILSIYDAMTESIRTGVPYRTRLDPPPGPPVDSEGNFIPMAEWDAANWPSHIHPPREEVMTR